MNVSKGVYMDADRGELAIADMIEAIDRANVFFNDVMPQIGGIALQDYANLNELGMLLGKLSNQTGKRYVDPE